MVYFSDIFNVDESILESYGAMNISLLNDIPLFIDPFLLYASEKPEYRQLHENILDYHWCLLKSVNKKSLNSVFIPVTRFSGLQTLSHFSNDYIGVGALKLGSPIFHECRTIYFQPDC